MAKTYIPVLSIAGSDSSGGAGIQADIKTISALGAYAMTAVTAVTAQNTLGVDCFQAVSPEFVGSQIDAVFSDIRPSAVKIGMLANTAIAEVTADKLSQHGAKNVVLDPVLFSTSGSKLADDSGFKGMYRLFGCSDVITPNLSEAQTLSGLDSGNISVIADALRKEGARNVLVTGVIKSSFPEIILDILFDDEGMTEYINRRIETVNTHGTGCTLSSAIATFLALGNTLREAVALAEEYVHNAIDAGAFISVGQGHGPLNHFFEPHKLITI